MKITALRGVCIGIGQYLNAGDTADLDTATGEYLIDIGAVEELIDTAYQSEGEGERPSYSTPQQGELVTEH